MSARKNILSPYHLSTNQSLAANFTTTTTDVSYMDNCSVQINVTTTDSTGNFYVQASNDGSNFADLTLDGSPVAGGANDVIVINLNQLPFKQIRVRYASTVAGTGSCNIYVMTKEI